MTRTSAAVAGSSACASASSCSVVGSTSAPSATAARGSARGSPCVSRDGSLRHSLRLGSKRREHGGLLRLELLVGEESVGVGFLELLELLLHRRIALVLLGLLGLL